MKVYFLVLLWGGLCSFSTPVESVTKVIGTLRYPDGTELTMTWWRSGGVLARAQGTDLVVYREPEAWLVGNAGVGRHIVDSGPSLGFHLPIVVYGGRADWSQATLSLEIGRERDFVVSQKLPAEPIPGGAVRYVYREGQEIELRLVFVEGRPASIEILRRGSQVLRLDYQDYQTGLPVDWTLFSPPVGVKFED